MSEMLTHSRFMKGLQAGFDRFSQPKGSLTRLSNFLFTKRGGLTSCNGSLLLSSFNGSLQTLPANFGAWLELFLYQPIGSAQAYFGIYKDYAANLANPAGLAAVVGAAGALTGTYKYVVTALDGAGGETAKSNEATVVLATQKGSLTWTATPNAAGYNVYRTVAGGATGTEHLIPGGANVQTNAYTDNTADGALGSQTPPAINDTQQTQFVTVPSGSYGAANIIKTLPADAFPILDDTLGGRGGGTIPGGTSGAHGGNVPPTMQGGVSGAISPLPMIVGFANKMILALGNGVTPYQSDGTTGNTIKLTNTFTASYPAWALVLAVNIGDQIQANVAGTDYVFTAVQGGITNSSAHPTWPATLGVTVPDGTGSSVLWKNSGQVSGSPVPPGAAHEEVYAGSLWVANTSPTETADQLDGPSALRMSDLNSQNSWNPLNAAQIQPDDGDQCTGIKAFTIAEAGIAPQNFLTYFKNFSTFIIQGVFGSTDFSITRLQTDMGNIAPRSLQFVPGFGIMRLSHLGFARTDGITDKLENPEALRPYLFGGETDINAVDWNYLYFSKAAQTANPPMYCCACPTLPMIIKNVTFLQPQAAMSGGGGLPLSNYFVKVYLVNPANQRIAFTEVAATGGTGTTLTVTFPPINSSLYSYWIVYFGTTSNGEDQFLLASASATSLIITQNGISGTPGSSNGWLTRIFCYDLVLKAWAIVDMPFPISVLRQFRAPGTIPITVMGGFWDSGVRRWQMGDSTWDAGAANIGQPSSVQLFTKDAEVFIEGGTQNLFCNQVIIRGEGPPNQILVKAVVDGASVGYIPAYITMLGNKQYEARIRVMQTLESMHIDITTNGQVSISSIGYEVEKKPVGAALIFS